MRHHAEHVAFIVHNAGHEIGRAVDVPGRIERAIGRRVAEQNTPLAFECLDGLVVGDIIAFAMRDRHADHLPRVIAARERRVGALDAQIDVAADEFQLGIAHQHAGQKPGLAQDLEAVADAEHEAALRRVGADRIHDRRARRDRAAAQIIAVGEPARDHDEVGAGGQLRVGVPDHRWLHARHELERARHVALAIDAGKDEDGGFHGFDMGATGISGNRLIRSPRCDNSRSRYWRGASRPRS